MTTEKRLVYLEILQKTAKHVQVREENRSAVCFACLNLKVREEK